MAQPGAILRRATLFDEAVFVAWTKRLEAGAAYEAKLEAEWLARPVTPPGVPELGGGVR